MFKTVREDGRSYRDVAVDVLKDKQPDEIVTYKMLGVAMELSPVVELGKIQAAVNAANKTLLKVHNRGVKNVKNMGYRIVKAREHMLVATSQEVKADNAMVRALRWYEGTKLEEMTEIERSLHQGQHMLAEAIYQSHQQLDKRIKRIEDALDSVRGNKTKDE